MNIKRLLKYLVLALLLLTVGLVTFIVTNPKWCQDEYLRHEFESWALVTPVGEYIHEHSGPMGVEYSGSSDKLYEDAYLTPQNRRIIRIRPYASPGITVGFRIGVNIDSPDESLIVSSDKTLTSVNIADESDITFDSSASGRPVGLYDGHRGRYFSYRLEYHVKNETVEELTLENGDSFAGKFHFEIDGESYSFEFSSKLRYERRKRGCIGVPGMP